MLILASASPRRRELLAQAGYAFEVRPAHIDEDPRPGEDPIAYVVRLAREKAEAVFSEVSAGSEALYIDAEDSARLKPCPVTKQGDLGASIEPSMPRLQVLQKGLVVLGADTTVTLDRQILGKPADAEHAARMLRMLSGRTHRVITGVALATASGTEVAAEATAVRFLTFSDAEIAEYVATGEPHDKAGAYAIQGLAAKWIPRVEGCYFNVVGLPLALVAMMLESVRLSPAR